MLLKISPQVAAKVMGKDDQFVRIGLQRGLLPFGWAIQTREPSGRYDNGRWSYYIKPEEFLKVTGATEEDVRKVQEEIAASRASYNRKRRRR